MDTPEQKKARDTQFRERHREQIRAKDRERYHADLEKGRERGKAFKVANPELAQVYNTQYQRTRRQKLKMQIFDLLGRKCSSCGFDDWRALQIDHINGGGHQERKGAKSIDAYYKNVLLEGKSKYQILCANCNQIKRHEDGEHCVAWEMPEPTE